MAPSLGYGSGPPPVLGYGSGPPPVPGYGSGPASVKPSAAPGLAYRSANSGYESGSAKPSATFGYSSGPLPHGTAKPSAAAEYLPPPFLSTGQSSIPRPPSLSAVQSSPPKSPILAGQSSTPNLMISLKENKVEAARIGCYVADVINPILGKEKEWPESKLQDKVLEYLQKAAKAIIGIRAGPWQKIVIDYAKAFYEALWNALFDRAWIDDVEFSMCVAHGLKAFCVMGPVALDDIPHEAYSKAVLSTCETVNDSIRFKTYAWYIAKKSAENKAATSKIWGALEQARTKVLAQNMRTAEEFMYDWMQKTILLISQSNDGRPHEILRPQAAVTMFGEFLTKGGPPVKLMKDAGLSNSGAASTREIAVRIINEKISLAIEYIYAQYAASDWTCSNCKASVYGHLKDCYRCKVPRPPPAHLVTPLLAAMMPEGKTIAARAQIEMQQYERRLKMTQAMRLACKAVVQAATEWNCPSCQAVVYGYLDECYRCKAPKPGTNQSVTPPPVVIKPNETSEVAGGYKAKLVTPPPVKQSERETDVSVARLAQAMDTMARAREKLKQYSRALEIAKQLQVALPIVSIEPSAKFEQERESWTNRLSSMLKSQSERRRKEQDVKLPENMDIDSVLNVDDAYKGCPLYADFEFEDWVLFQLRFHVHLLLHAFKRDVDDPEHQGVHHTGFAFYHFVFFQSTFEEGDFGQDSFKAVFDLISDTIRLDSSTGMLYPEFDDDLRLDELVKLVYAEKSLRAEMYEAGDETALLRFPRERVLGLERAGGSRVRSSLCPQKRSRSK